MAVKYHTFVENKLSYPVDFTTVPVGGATSST